MPIKKKSCELVQQGIAGPAPDQILEAIRAEYWLPATSPQPAARKQRKDSARPDQPAKPKTKVKP